jgi:hypothetical protein
LKNCFIALSASLLLAISPTLAASKPATHKQPVRKSAPRSSSSHPAMLSNFAFRGNRIGDPGAAVIERVFKPEEPANPTTSSTSSQMPEENSEFMIYMRQRIQLQREQAEKDKAECLKALSEQNESTCTEMYPHLPGDSMITYEFFKQKLSGFRMSFSVEHYSAIESMLIGKYGKPHKTIISPIQNRMGAQFEQITSIWNTAYGPMKLYYRYPNPDKGFLVLRDSKIEHLLDVQKEKELQQKGKSAF